MNNPKVSILMANFNNGEFIIHAINSVLQQTYKNLELIIVDDASTEDTAGIIAECLKNDNQILFFKNKKNLGYGTTLRECAKYATGDYLAILDPDDMIVPNAVETIVEVFRKHPNASLVYSNMYMCDEYLNVLQVNKRIGPIPKGQTYQSINPELDSHIMHFRAISTSAYKKTTGFDIEFKKAIDKDIIYKVEEVGETIFIDVPLYYYRQHKGSISLFKNKWKARLWEVRAKERALKRRRNTTIPSLTIEQIESEYQFVFKNLAHEALDNKERMEYIKWIIKYFLVKRSVNATVSFIYYSIKKNRFPHLFIHSDEKN